MQLAATMYGVMVFRSVESGPHRDLVGVGRSGVHGTPEASTAVQNPCDWRAPRDRVLGTQKRRSPAQAFARAAIESHHQ